MEELDDEISVHSLKGVEEHVEYAPRSPSSEHLVTPPPLADEQAENLVSLTPVVFQEAANTEGSSSPGNDEEQQGAQRSSLNEEEHQGSVPSAFETAASSRTCLDVEQEEEHATRNGGGQSTLTEGLRRPPLDNYFSSLKEGGPALLGLGSRLNL